MKILRVIAGMDPAGGGPCQGIRNSIPALNALGCENEVVCAGDPAAEFIGKDPFPLHVLGLGRGPWGYLPPLQDWLMKNSPRFDAVILHGLWLYPGAAVRRAAARTGTPYFIFPHGMLDPWFQKDPSRRLKALRNVIYWKAIENRVVRDAAGLLFTCEEERRLAALAFRPYRPAREFTPGYGVPEPPAATAGMGAAFAAACPAVSGRPYLLFLSRIHPKKGVDLLIKAYAKVLSEEGGRGRPLPDLVIAGPGGDTPYGLSLKELAAETVAPGEGGSRIQFPGMLQGDAKWGAFYGCQAFVLPSHQENFGIAVAEALACGRAVLISRQVNIWREIEDAGAGWTAGDTVDGTASLLRQWCVLSADEQIAAGERAKSCFHQRFGIASAAGRLLESLRAGLRAAKVSV